MADKPDIVVQDDVKRIHSLLLSYVTEEQNPQNRLSVQKATLECKSPILENGTVLIDTPGFGSTHLHNTKTSIDLLANCDASLFLLSADLPITQTEVEFQTSKTAARLFLIRHLSVVRFFR